MLSLCVWCCPVFICALGSSLFFFFCSCPAFGPQLPDKHLLKAMILNDSNDNKFLFFCVFMDSYHHWSSWDQCQACLRGAGPCTLWSFGKASLWRKLLLFSLDCFFFFLLNDVLELSIRLTGSKFQTRQNDSSCHYFFSSLWHGK